MGFFSSTGITKIPIVGGVLGGLEDVAAGKATSIGGGYDPFGEPFQDTREQSSFLAHLSNQVYGPKESGPSVAENLLASQTQKNVEQMAGAIGSTRGVQNPALLARQASRIGAGQMQESAGQAATLRAQEGVAQDQLKIQQQGQYAEQLGRQNAGMRELETLMSNIGLQRQQLQAQANEGAATRQSQFIGALGSGFGFTGQAGGMMKGGGGAAVASSDIRVKKNIEPATGQAKDYLDFQYRKMLDQVDPYTYDYKNDKYGKGKQLGVMAQDLEKSELGKGMVKTKDGKKEINANISTILAGQAVLNDRLNKIEGNKMQNEKDYLTYYQSPEYDPNEPNLLPGPINLETMQIGGRLGQQRSPDISGVAPSRGATFDGSRPLNTMDYPTLEDGPSKIESVPVLVRGNIPTTPVERPLTAEEIENKANLEKRKKLDYLIDAYGRNADRINSYFTTEKLTPKKAVLNKIPAYVPYLPSKIK